MDKNNRDRDGLLAQPPPFSMIQLFTRAHDTNSAQIHIARQDNSVGQTINSDLQEDLQQLKIFDVDLEKYLADAHLQLEKAVTTRKDFHARLSMMEIKANASPTTVRI